MLTAALVVVALIVLLLLLLAIPISLTFAVSLKEKVQGDFELRWAFGLVRIRNPSFASNIRASKPKKRKRKQVRSDRPARPGKNFIAVIQQRSFRRRIYKYGRELWRAVRKRDINFRLRVGFDDPADTGLLWAVFGPLSVMLSNMRETVIAIEPIFHETLFEFEGRGNIRLVPLHVLYLTLGLIFSPSVWQAARRLRAPRT